MSYEDTLSNTQYWAFVNFGFQIVDTEQGSQLIRYDERGAIEAKLTFGEFENKDLLELYVVELHPRIKVLKRLYNFKRLPLNDFLKEHFEQNNLKWKKQ